LKDEEHIDPDHTAPKFKPELEQTLLSFEAEECARIMLAENSYGSQASSSDDAGLEESKVGPNGEIVGPRPARQAKVQKEPPLSID